MQEKDFSQRSRFPGTTGNRFDTILHAAQVIEGLHWPVFAAILLLSACFAVWFVVWSATILWGFFLLDWALLASLPRAGKSFGPPQPPILLLALLRVPFMLLPDSLSWAAQIMGTLLVIYAFWIEPHHIRLTRQTFETAKLSPGSRLRVMHIADLHIERITHRERQLNRMVAEIQPDLILFSGDFLNLTYRQDLQAVQWAREIISEWRAPAGVFAVTGSPAVDLEAITPQILAGLDIHWLQGEVIDLAYQSTHLVILGLPCTHKPWQDKPILESLVQSAPEGFKLLLYHSPDLAPGAATLGIDLMLCGHTHGGQVRLPVIGALFTGSLYGRTFQMGRYVIGKMILYISRGLGMEGAGAPRVRFLCPPEVILWEIKGCK